LAEAVDLEGVETWAQDAKKAKNIKKIVVFIRSPHSILYKNSSEEKRGQFAY
jgi:hypothetical protein